MSKNRRVTRLTKQKKTILACIRRFRPIHPTSGMIYEKVKKEIPNISLGTVYRNLNSLREMGFVEEIPTHNEPSQFDSRVDAHLHFRCEGCGKLFEIEDPVILTANQKRINEKGFQSRRSTVLYFGICKDCQSKEQNKQSLKIKCVACGRLKTEFPQKSLSCKVCGFQEECLYLTT